MTMEYIVPSLRIATVMDMFDRNTMEEQLARLVDLEEDRFVIGFHQQVQKDHHIKCHTFKVEDLVLIYDSKFTKFAGKFQMHWLGPYVVEEITDGGVVQLTKLNGELFPDKVNGSQLKLYRGDPAPT